MIIFKKLTFKSIFYDTRSRGSRSHDRMEAGFTCLYTNPYYHLSPSKFVNSIPALTEVYLINKSSWPPQNYFNIVESANKHP